MIFSGFSDEAGLSTRIQIQATQSLGWRHIEARRVDAKDFADLDDAEFEAFADAVASAGIQVHCIGSAVAGWNRSPTSDEDFAKDLRDLDVLLPRMQQLGVKLLRGMSYKIDAATRFDAPELEQVIFTKVRRLVGRCAEFGVVYAHENCMNYGGQSHEHTMRLVDAVNHDHFKLVFDTGNPVFTFRRIGSYRPYPLQSAWEFYRNVRDLVVHVHIKDGIAEPPANDIDRPDTRYTWAGDGAGQVRPILLDLAARGYDGAFSIEPHVATVFHEADDRENSDLASHRRLETYIEYGKRFEKLVAECGFTKP